MVSITYQYCRFCGSTCDNHHIEDLLVWVVQVVCKLCNGRWKTFFVWRVFVVIYDRMTLMIGINPFCTGKGAYFFIDMLVGMFIELIDLIELVNKL